MKKPDEETPEPEPPNRHGGYTAAASWLSSDPDSESFIFRKFDKLAALNLLYMQSEILELERRVEDMHGTTLKSYDMDLKDAASTWETLVRQCQPGGPGFRSDARERMDLILQLRSRLKEYHEALLLQGQVAGLRRPEDRVIEAVKHFFERPQHILGGRAKTLFDETSTNGFSDLVALKSSCETDILSNFLRRHWHDEVDYTLLSLLSLMLIDPLIPRYQVRTNILPPDSQDELARDGVSRFKRFREASIARTVSVVTVMVAAVFLIGTMVGFYFVQSAAVKLVMIAGFTTAFAGSLGLITNARRVEIFAATAAYAAVLVVFVSNSDLSAS